MRTTISIDDEVLAAAMRRAAELGTSVESVVEDAVRRALAAPVTGTPELPVFRGGKGSTPRLDLTSNRAVRQLLDDGVPLERRR